MTVTIMKLQPVTGTTIIRLTVSIGQRGPVVAVIMKRAVIITWTAAILATVSIGQLDQAANFIIHGIATELEITGIKIMLYPLLKKAIFTMLIYL